MSDTSTGNTSCNIGSCSAINGHEGTCAEASGWDETVSEVEALALVISNAYLKRHGLPTSTMHAGIDEDIAAAILAAGFVSPATLAVKVAEGKAAGVDLAEEVLVKHDCFTSRTLDILEETAAAIRAEIATMPPLVLNGPVKRLSDGLSTDRPKEDLDS
jgi:hypothetical protein